MEYVAHYFERMTDTLRSLYSVGVAGETVEDAHAAALALLPSVNGALGFRLCDRTDRQVDIYVPADLFLRG